MFIGNYDAKIESKNEIGGGIAVIQDGEYKGKKIGFSKFCGFQNDMPGDTVRVFLQHGHFLTISRKGA